MIISEKENVALGLLRGHMVKEIEEQHDAEWPIKLKWTIEIPDDESWINIKAEADGPYVVPVELPRYWAMWRESRDIYIVRHGEVMDDLPVLREPA